jgi:hypothetical protein
MHHSAAAPSKTAVLISVLLGKVRSEKEQGRSLRIFLL